MAISMQESTKVDGGNPRRNSLRKAVSSKNVEKILPHYLQASSGSCHDFCKYGRHHELENKPRIPFLRRKKKTPCYNHISVEVLAERKKKPVVKTKPQPNLNTYKLDSPAIIKREVSTKSFDIQPSSPMPRKTPGASITEPIKSHCPVRKVTAKKKTSVPQMLTNSADSHSSLSSGIFSDKTRVSIHGKQKASTNEPRTSPVIKSHLSPRIRRQNASLLTETSEVSSKLASVRPKEVDLSAKHAISSKRNLSPPCASELSSGGRKSDIKMGPKTRTPRMMVMRSQVSPQVSLSPKSSSCRVRRVVTSKTSCDGVTRGFSSPKASLSSKVSMGGIESLNAKKQRGLKVISPLNIQSKIRKVNNFRPKVKNTDPDKPNRELKLKETNKDLVQEKTLYVINVETQSKYVDSDVNSKVSVESSSPPSSSPRASSPPKSPSLSEHDEEDNESEYSETEAEEEPHSDYDEIDYVKYAQALEGANNGGHGIGRVVPSEDKDGLPVKLRFRRGKVVDIMSESRSPRRLKYRRARTLTENKNCKNDSRMNIKRTEANETANDLQEDSEKVVLRHQDVQGKKDAQGLLNNIIEETASKLVETRRSKVKALVGAFETVISFKDGNPSANIVS